MTLSQILAAAVPVLTVIVAGYTAWSNYKSKKNQPSVDAAAAALSAAQAERIKQEILADVLREAKEDMARLREERDALSTENKELSARIDTLSTRVDKVESENEKLRQQVVALQKENAALKKLVNGQS